MGADAPECIKELLSNVLTLPNTHFELEVTDKRLNRFVGYELAILMTCSVLGPQKVIE